MPEIYLPSKGQLDDLIRIGKVQIDDNRIFGAKWDKSSSPILTRTDAAATMTANAGVDFTSVANDFDSAPIWGEIEEVTDTYDNVFVRIPKAYLRRLDGTDFRLWQVSKRRYPGFYLPWCFWDFDNKRELPYVDIGKYPASLSADNKLQSKPDVYPLVNTNIVNMRTYAKNNNVNGLKGYQQFDIHAVDLLQSLFTIEFATLNSQSIMQGWTAGNYTGTHLATIAETGVNRIILANANANLYAVGQPIGLGTSQGGNQIAYGRTITAIDVYDADNKAISFDGIPVDIAVGNFLYNVGWKNGFSRNIAASSGSLVSNSDGKHPMMYRGMEGLYSNVYQFVDGANINERQAWVAKNPADYTSNVFANPYEQLSYVNLSADGYVREMGFDINRPYANFATLAGGSASTYYTDNYYQATGQRIARFGGYWANGSAAGLFCWHLSDASSFAYVYLGGRLLKKPLP